MDSNQYGIFATSTVQIQDAPATGGAIQGVPSIEKITFHLLRYVLLVSYQFFFFLQFSRNLYTEGLIYL